MKASNNKWTLLVYEDVGFVRKALDHIGRILESLEEMLSQNTPRMISFYSTIKTHVSLLYQISNDIELKYSEIFTDIEKTRYKRGLMNVLGETWKIISGSLSADDGEYYSKCIEKFNKDEHELENLMKNKISVTSSVIKNFNTTIQKLQIDEKTFNENLQQIEQSMADISDNFFFYQAQLNTLEICEYLLESYTFLEDSLNNILNSITFSRLINSLKEISQR